MTVPGAQILISNRSTLLIDQIPIDVKRLIFHTAQVYKQIIFTVFTVDAGLTQQYKIIRTKNLEGNNHITSQIVHILISSPAHSLCLLELNPVHLDLVVNELVDVGDDGGALDVHEDEAGGDV